MTAVVLTAAPESPRFTRLSVEDGLSQSSVQQILQDSRGLLWFATQEGLNRYDGYRFTVHRARDQPGFLGDHDIHALIEGAGGDLWVGTSRGLYRYDLATGRFDGCAPPVDRLEVIKLVRSGDGRIFFATSDGRLWVLDPADPQRRARALDDGAFAALNGVTALAAGRGSAIWAAAQGRLFKVDTLQIEPSAQLTEALADLGKISVLATDAHGDVWIGGINGDLLRYRPAGGEVTRFPQAPHGILAILPGRHGELWIGARSGGLGRLTPETGELVVYRHDPEDSSSLSSDDVAAIYEDANGGLWVGSWNGGVNRFDPHGQAFRYRARSSDSLPADDVIAMTEMTDGKVWLASRGGIVAAGDPRSGRFRTAAVLPGPWPLTAIGAWDARVLVGTGRGLALLDAPSGRVVALGEAFRAHRLDVLSIAAIRSAPGIAWIASGQDLFRAAGGGGRGPESVDRLEVLIRGSISALSTAASGRLWIGTDRGEIARAEWSGPGAAVAMRSLDAVSPSDRAALAAHGVVSALYEDPQGRLWVGTRRGLGRIDLSSGSVSWLGQGDGLPSTNIAGIEADEAGRLWIGHNRGITRLDPASGAMTHFGERDGAQGKGYAEGASVAGASGLIYFAGEGVTVFDPRQVSVNPYRPGIVFTALDVLHREVSPRWLDPDSPIEQTITATSELVLGPEATVFSVEMAPLHYADPMSNRLRYQLEGFDREWIEADAYHRVATYTNLAPGHYVLRARAETRSGLWSEGEATLAIRIRPAWWRSRVALAGWFVMAVAAAGAILAEARRRVRARLALQALRLDSLTDPLTGLHNRRFLVPFLEPEVPKLVREHRGGDAAAAEAGGLLLLLIDVDRFKSFNDRHSHAVGDRVLSRIAGVLKEHTRGSDLAVRWGGDEFLVVSRSFQRSGAADAAERLRSAVEAIGPVAEGGPACTVSIGCAAFPFLPRQPQALTWEQTLEVADHALRLTKNRRRNSYTCLRANAGVTAAAVLAFLKGGGGELPAGVEVVMPEDEVRSPPSASGSLGSAGYETSRRPDGRSA